MHAHPQNYRRGRGGQKVTRVVIHVAAGYLRGTASWFQNPKAGVSAHYTVGSLGDVIQSVSESDTAFHAGPVPIGQPDMNSRSIGIEHEGWHTAAGFWKPTEAQLATTAELVADICRRHGIPADRTHIIGHNEVFPGREARKNCPGPGWPWDRFLALVHSYLLVQPAPPVVQSAPVAPKSRTVRLMDAGNNRPLGTATLVADKVYLTPETLQALRDQLK